MIDGSFTGSGYPGMNAGTCSQPAATIPPNVYFPQAKLGAGNYVYVWSGGIGAILGNSAMNGVNYFGVSSVSAADGNIWSTPGLTVQQAYNIDKKMEDGLPQTGHVIAAYISAGFWWAAGGGNFGQLPGFAASPSATSCYDNGGNAANPMQYSLTQNGGAGVNCALSFQFQ